MIRAYIEEALLFLLPFGVFATWLIITKRNPLEFTNWNGAKFWLTATGLVLAIASVIVVALWAEPHTGAYVPARVENGRLIPGEVRDAVPVAPSAPQPGARP
jgi:hypothetical protein